MWKVYYSSLEPDFVEVKEDHEDVGVKTLFFEATKFGKKDMIVNGDLYEDYKWVPEA